MIRDEFLGAAGASGGGGNPTTPSDLVAFSYSTSGGLYIGVYQWSSSGFGAQLSGSPITISGGGGVSGIRFSPDRTKLFYTTSLSPYINGYNITSSAIGTKLSNPTVLPSPVASIAGISISQNNDFIAFGVDGAPYLNVYALTSSGFGAKQADPSTQNFPGAISASSGYDVSFSPDQSAIALGYVANSGGVYTAAWRWSASGFGAQYANVNWGSTGFNDGCRGIEFTPDGQAVVAVRNSSNENAVGALAAWRWTSASGFGTRFSSPAAPWTGSPWFQTTRSVSVSPANNAVLCTSAGGAQADSAAPLHVFRWSSSTGFGTMYSYQAAGVGFSIYNQSDCAKFSSDGSNIIMTTYNQPLNFFPTDRLVSSFSFTYAAGPAFLAYAPVSITSGGASYATFN
jgi:hypothetical protein